MATAITALVVVGCASSAPNRGDANSGTAQSTPDQAHPQVIEPVAGQAATGRTTTQFSQSGDAALRAPGPNQPASVTSALAKGAPSDAQVRAEVARFKAAIAKYHLDRLNLSGALLNPAQLPPGQYYVSIASVFTDYGLPIACGGVLKVPELGVANKTLPCGTMVTFVYGGRAIRIPVIDRGPYIAGREWDLTGAAAEALHFPGLGPIEWRLG